MTHRHDDAYKLNPSTLEQIAALEAALNKELVELQETIAYIEIELGDIKKGLSTQGGAFAEFVTRLKELSAIVTDDSPGDEI